MTEPRFLVVRLGSLGDIVHAFPAVSGLRTSFPNAEIIWLTHPKWEFLVKTSGLATEVWTVDTRNWSNVRSILARIRKHRFEVAIDYQGLWKSAAIPFLARIPRRIGFSSETIREAGVPILYTDRVKVSAERHVADQNAELSMRAGARFSAGDIKLRVPEDDEEVVRARIAQDGTDEYIVLSPGGGWRSKCWPAERYGLLAETILEQFGLRIPLFSTDVWRGLSQIAPLLVTAIPLGIYNFTEAMNNVESASAAGDNYNLRKILLADGLGAIVGSMLGSPFPPAVYIGHPGWKAVGGRVGYSLATGGAIALVCFLGLTALLLAIIPLVAILPILLYIGLVIGAQAFQASPAKHAPAVVLALIPNIAEWAKTQIDGALAAAGTSAGQVGLEKLAGTGVLYKGLETLGGGSVLAGMVLGALAVFVIDNKLRTAAVWAFVGAVLSYIGLIHGAQLGWAVSPLVALGYVMFAAVCLALSKSEPQMVAAE